MTVRRSLAVTQAWFRRAICSPPRDYAKVAARAGEVLVVPPGVDTAERLLVYARDYWARCLDSLKEDFPGLLFLMGEKRFLAWMGRYLVKHPSRSYTLRDLGSRLPRFLDARYRGPCRTCVLDMARFEWAKIEAFDRDAREPFDPRGLTARQAAVLAQTPLAVQPHVQLVELGYPVFRIVDGLYQRRVNGRRARIGRRLKKADYYSVVYRRDGKVFHKEIERPLFLILAELQRGLGLESACEKVLRRLRPKEMVLLESRAAAWFQGCVANGWLGQPAAKGAARERDQADFSEGGDFSRQNRVAAAPPRPSRRRIRLLHFRKRKTAPSR